MYKKGQMVRHPLKPEWKYGLILEALSDSKIKVMFLGCGEKLLNLEYAKVEKIASGPLLEAALDTFRTKFRLDKLSKKELLQIVNSENLDKSVKTLKKEEIVDYLMDTVYS